MTEDVRYSETVTQDNQAERKDELEVEDLAVTTKVPVRLWTVVFSVFTACFLSLLVGATLTYSSPVLVELTQLRDPDLRFNTLLSDIFGVRDAVISHEAMCSTS